MPVDTSGLRRKIEQYGDRLAGEAAADLFRTVDEPVDTGQLKGTGRLTRLGPRLWRIHYSASYASYTDLGTRPHRITPKRPGGVLVFNVGGKTIFARHVDHPGTEGTGWFSDVVDRTGWIRALTAAKRRMPTV